MQSITFTCETITPMFLAGADGITPELRAPSIKGALRFWWRAMNGHKSLKQLQEDETKLFGGTGENGGRSKIILIKQSAKLLTTKPALIALTPHHKIGYCNKYDKNKNCIWNDRTDSCNKANPPKSGSMTGKFTFLVKFDENTIEQTDLEQLLKVTFLLGGLGKRERRGFGSCSIAINDEKCFETIQDVKEFIQDLNLPIESKLEYPYLEKVSIGKKYDSCFAILEDIGLQSHNFNGLYDIHLGFAMRKQHFDKERMASPIYVSVFQDTTGQDTIGFYPIISKLHCAFSKKVEKAIEGYEVKDRSSDFVNALKSTN